MRTVATNELSGIELEWVYGEVTLGRQYVHELDESVLFLVDLEDARKTSPQRCEITQDHGFCARAIERHRLSVCCENDGFLIEGFADPRPRGEEPRKLSGFSKSLPEAVFRAICSYGGDSFDIPRNVASLHDKRVAADIAFWEEMEDGPTMDELRAMGVFDGVEFQ